MSYNSITSYIEKNIDKIERNDTSISIFQCPTEIVTEYVKTLKSVGAYVHNACDRYAEIVDYLTATCRIVTLWNYSIESDQERYHFHVTSPKFSFKDINHVLSNKFISYWVSINIESDNIFSDESVTITLTKF